MDTRLAPRVPVSLEVSIILDKDAGQKITLSREEKFQVQAVDLSISGLGILSKYFLPSGLRVIVEIEGKLLRLAKPIELKGEVRYCKFIKTKEYRCGIKFIEIDSSWEKKISDFIRSNERRSEPRISLSE